MKFVTNFIEFNQEKDAPSVREATNKEIISHKESVLAYMKDFEEDVVCPSKVRDEITGEMTDITLIYYTDGEFAWDERDIYHFEKYNIPLDKEFIKKILG